MSGAIPSCSSAPQQLRARHERLDRPRVVGRLDPPPHAQRDRRDDAQRPLGPEHELPQRRPRRGARRVQRRQRPRGRHARQRHDLLVDPPVPGGRLPGRARRRAPADRRPLVRLRHVPQLQPLRAQRRVGLGQPDPRLEHRDQRPRVDRDHADPAAPGPTTPAPRTARARPPARRPRSSRPRTAPRPRRTRARRSTSATARVDPGATTASGAEANRPTATPAGPGRTSRGPQHPRRHVVAHLGDGLQPLAQPGRQRRRRQRHVLQRDRRDTTRPTRRAPRAAARPRAQAATARHRARPSPRRPARASLAR